MGVRSTIYACTLALLVSCQPASNTVAPTLPSRQVAASATINIDRESTRQKLERLVEIPGKERSQVDWLMSLRAHQSLLALGRAGFDEFVACVGDRRPVWSDLARGYDHRTTLGETCLTLITEHVDALYLDEGGLDFVTADNALDWWQGRRDIPLADLQIEALVRYRDREAARAASTDREVRVYLESELLPDLERRIAKARHEREQGLRLTIER